MNEITSIVNSVLEKYDGCYLGQSSRNTVATAIASKLMSASLQQLADLLGGSVGVDNGGEAVIYTSINLCDEHSYSRGDR